MFLGEFRVGCGAVLADAYYHGVDLFEILIYRGKGAGLPCAAWGIVLGIEIEHHLFAQKGREGHRVAVLVGKCKIGGFCRYFQHFYFSFLINI